MLPHRAFTQANRTAPCSAWTTAVSTTAAEHVRARDDAQHVFSVHTTFLLHAPRAGTPPVACTRRRNPQRSFTGSWSHHFTRLNGGGSLRSMLTRFSSCSSNPRDLCHCEDNSRVVLTICDGFSHGGLAFTAHLWVDGVAEQAGAGAEAEADRASRAKGKSGGNVCYVTHNGKLSAIHPVPDTARMKASSGKGERK